MTRSQPSNVFIVNPYAHWVQFLCIFTAILSAVIGSIVIVVFNEIVGLSISMLGMAICVPILPYVRRNCFHFVRITENQVELVREERHYGLYDYITKKSFSMSDVCVTLVGPYRKVTNHEYCYKAYFCDRYLTQSDLGSKFQRKNSFYLVVNYNRLEYLLQYYNKPVHVYLRKNVTDEVVLYKCECHNYYVALLSKAKEKNSPVNFDDFKNISKRAVVAYSLCCLENALEFYNNRGDGWNVLLSYLWKFTQLEETDTDAVKSWFGLYDLLPNSFARPYDKYLKSHGRFKEEIELERVSQEEYELIELACNDSHSVIGELCEGILDLAAATTADFFYDVSYSTLFALHECVLDVMERNDIPLADVNSFSKYPHEVPQDGQSSNCWGKTFDASIFSKILRPNQSE